MNQPDKSLIIQITAEHVGWEIYSPDFPVFIMHLSRDTKTAQAPHSWKSMCGVERRGMSGFKISKISMTH
jgi:hypothetical protein